MKPLPLQTNHKYITNMETINNKTPLTDEQQLGIRNFKLVVEAAREDSDVRMRQIYANQAVLMLNGDKYNFRIV